MRCEDFSSCGARAPLPCGAWNPPRPGVEPISPALAGGCSATGSPGKSCPCLPILTSVSVWGWFHLTDFSPLCSYHAQELSLHAGHYEFYLVGCWLWLFLYSYKYSRALFSDTEEPFGYTLILSGLAFKIC